MLDERKSIFADIFISKKGIFYKLHTYTTIHLPIHIVLVKLFLFFEKINVHIGESFIICKKDFFSLMHNSDKSDGGSPSKNKKPTFEFLLH